MKFVCPNCNDVVEDRWITNAKVEERVRCPVCKSGFVVSIRPIRHAVDTVSAVDNLITALNDFREANAALLNTPRH